MMIINMTTYINIKIVFLHTCIKIIHVPKTYILYYYLLYSVSNYKKIY